MTNKHLGRVLWYSSKDENGIIIDSKGSEYYFDRSVVHSAHLKKVFKGAIVLFLPTRNDGLLAAKQVSLPKSSSQKKYQSQFEFEQAQLSLDV